MVGNLPWNYFVVGNPLNTLSLYYLLVDEDLSSSVLVGENPVGCHLLVPRAMPLSAIHEELEVAL